MSAEVLVGDEPEIDHLTAPWHVGLEQLVHQSGDAAGQRFRTGDPDVDIAAMVAAAAGRDPKRKIS